MERNPASPAGPADPWEPPGAVLVDLPAPAEGVRLVDGWPVLRLPARQQLLTSVAEVLGTAALFMLIMAAAGVLRWSNVVGWLVGLSVRLVLPRRDQVQLDAVGVRQRRGLATRQLTWNQVTGVRVRRRGGVLAVGLERGPGRRPWWLVAPCGVRRSTSFDAQAGFVADWARVCTQRW